MAVALALAYGRSPALGEPKQKPPESIRACQGTAYVPGPGGGSFPLLAEGSNWFATKNSKIRPSFRSGLYEVTRKSFHVGADWTTA